jgi:hypothetical protein
VGSQSPEVTKVTWNLPSQIILHYSELVGPARVLTERRYTQSLKFLVLFNIIIGKYPGLFKTSLTKGVTVAILINNPFAIGHSDFGSASMLEWRTAWQTRAAHSELTATL